MLRVKTMPQDTHMVADGCSIYEYIGKRRRRIVPAGARATARVLDHRYPSTGPQRTVRCTLCGCSARATGRRLLDSVRSESGELRRLQVNHIQMALVLLATQTESVLRLVRTRWLNLCEHASSPIVPSPAQLHERQLKIALPRSIASDALCGADVPLFHRSCLRLPGLLPRLFIAHSTHKPML